MQHNEADGERAPKWPVQRVYRMAYCTTVTFHDEAGAAPYTIRQGAGPSVEPVDLCDRLFADAVAILAQCPPASRVVSDGAPEMRHLLRMLDEPTQGTTAHELLDFWHLLEEVAAAARVMYKEADRHDVLRCWRVDLIDRNAAPDDMLTALRASGRRPFRWESNGPCTTLRSIRKLSRHAPLSRRAPTGLPIRQRRHQGDL